MKKMEFKNYKNEVLKGLHFENKEADKRIFIVEGMEEHSSRYKELAEYLNMHGFDVFCIDAIGQGENILPDESNKGFWQPGDFNRYVDFLADVISNMNRDRKKTYLFCHSMGSFMGQAFIQRHAGLVDKIILCGSGGKNPALGIGKFLAKITTTKKSWNKKAKLMNKMMFGSFNKKIKNPRTPYDWLSYNEENVDKYIADPLCGYGPTKGFCLEFINGMIPLYKKENLERIHADTKIYIISGDEDPVTNYGKFTTELVNMYKEYGVKEVSYKIYKHARHEIHNDNVKKEVFRDIANFFAN